MPELDYRRWATAARPGVPPDRQLKFRMDQLCTSVWVQHKAPSSYQVTD